jgi:hypothetical protein
MYRHLSNGRIQRTTDGVTFPHDDRVELFKQYAEWLAQGGTPEIEWDPPAQGLEEVTPAGIVTRIVTMGLVEAAVNWWKEGAASDKMEAGTP